jgi:hypothetical protein
MATDQPWQQINHGNRSLDAINSNWHPGRIPTPDPDKDRTTAGPVRSRSAQTTPDISGIDPV